jgi:hypothetical protein
MQRHWHLWLPRSTEWFHERVRREHARAAGRGPRAQRGVERRALHLQAALRLVLGQPPHLVAAPDHAMPRRAEEAVRREHAGEPEPFHQAGAAGQHGF